MKHFKLHYLLICLLLFNCTKSKNEQGANNNEKIEVLEFKTKEPIASAKLDLYRCTNYDNIFGCLAKAIFASGITDKNGIYNFKPGELNRADEGILLSKSNYWTAGGGTGTVFMYPEAWISLHVVKQNIYPDTSLFQIRAEGENYSVSLVTFHAPVDSIIKIRAFGNQVNSIKWHVIVKDTKCYQYCPTDTLASGNLVQNLGKFETVPITISY